jgi:ferrous iron transport protein A
LDACAPGGGCSGAGGVDEPFFGQVRLGLHKDKGFKDMDKLDISGSTLDQAVIGETMTVQRVDAPLQSLEWSHWLEEIGFVAGEQVRLMARAIPGGDPMVVRIGQSTFALRRAEAACISVAPVGACAAASLEDQVVVEGAGA